MYKLPPANALYAYFMVFTVLCLGFFYKVKWKNPFAYRILFSLLLSFSIIIVGSEYWEVAIFVYAWLGLYGHKVNLIGEIHHLNIILIFAALVFITKVKFNKTSVLTLFLGVCSSFMFLPPSPLYVDSALTRCVALCFLGFFFYKWSFPYGFK